MPDTLNRTPHGFEASLVHPDLGDEPVAGRLFAGQIQLQFQSEAVSLDLPWRLLRWNLRKGARGSFFTRPAVRI